MTTTRRSKIARLPDNIRNELNERLEDGQAAEPLLLWLNALPETRKTLKEYFSSQPISECNLTHWRHSGYPDWLAEHRGLELAELLSRQAQGAEAASQGPLGEQLSVVLTLRMAGLMQKLLAVDDEKSSPEQQWQHARELVREVDRVRRSDHRARQLKLQEEQWEREQQRQFDQDEKAAKEADKKFQLEAVLDTVNLPLRIQVLTPVYQSPKIARWVAETEHAIKYGLAKDWNAANHKRAKKAKNGAPSGEPKAGGGFAAAGVDLTAPGAQAQRPPGKLPTAGPEGGTDLGREETGGQDPGGAGPPV